MSKFSPLRSIGCALLLSAFVATPAFADSAHTKTEHFASTGMARVGDLVISSAWTRQTPPGAKVGGAYFTITNEGDSADRLIGGEAAFAKRVEIHEMSVTDGVMRMQPVEGGLEIKPGETVELKPGGYHVMFMGLSENPKKGGNVNVTLRFEEAGETSFLIPVAGIGATSLEGHDGDHGDDHSKMDHSGHDMKKDDQ
jgi:copper(I)-binding protein